MSYKTYITDALVCGSRNDKTSDKSYLLFTREAGMLYASAKSVREERSKHRYALQEFSHARVTLVRGRSGWKVTGAEAVTDFYARATTRETRTFLRDIVRLLRRLIRGEEAHPALFDETHRVLLGMNESYGEEEMELYTLRLLYMLGYIAPTDTISPLLTGTFRDALPYMGSEGKNERTALIESAFHASQL